jgi:hydroxyacylglutathione hydrolase
VQIISLPVLKDNYTYLVVCPETRKACVIDSPDAPLIRQTVKKLGIELVAILNTHHHWDHIGANEDLLSKQKLEVYGSYYDENRIPGITKRVKQGDSVQIGSIYFQVLDVPGHTLGHVAYYTKGALFCGDTLFVASCGRLFEGTPVQMFDSLEKLKKLPQDTLLYCAHEYSQKNLEFALTLEPDNQALQQKYQQVLDLRSRDESTVPTALSEELSYNPFLRTNNLQLKQKMVEKGYKSLNKEVDVFAALRDLKDKY